MINAQFVSAWSGSNAQFVSAWGQIHTLAAQAIDLGACDISMPVLGEPGGAYWPPAYAVLAGMVYGPTGADYTGTLAIGGSGPSAADIAAELLAQAQVTPIHSDAPTAQDNATAVWSHTQ